MHPLILPAIIGGGGGNTFADLVAATSPGVWYTFQDDDFDTNILDVSGNDYHLVKGGVNPVDAALPLRSTTNKSGWAGTTSRYQEDGNNYVMENYFKGATEVSLTFSLRNPSAAAVASNYVLGGSGFDNANTAMRILALNTETLLRGRCESVGGATAAQPAFGNYSDDVRIYTCTFGPDGVRTWQDGALKGGPSAMDDVLRNVGTQPFSWFYDGPQDWITDHIHINDYELSEEEIVELHAAYRSELIYEPGMMRYDGTSYYDLGDTFTASGNLVTGTIRFSRETFTGDGFEYLLRYSADGGKQRLGVLVLSSDYSADTTLQGKVLVQSRDATNTPLCRLINVDSIDVLDGNPHTLFYAFNGTTGDALLYIDGQNADKSDWTGRTLTTGALPTGDELVMVGAIPGQGYFNGDIGYVSFADDYLTNPTDFYHPTNGLQEIDTTDWPSSPWGAQPLGFADDGKMDTNNDGSTSAFTKNGTITGPA